MDIGIIGLPSSGKTTIFNACTKGSANIARFSSQDRPHIGIAKVPDGRLSVLEHMYNPKRVIAAEVNYLDMPASPEHYGEKKVISATLLNYLQKTEAFLIVVRAFEDPTVAYNQDSIDPVRDVETMLYELIFTDLEILDRRILRLESDQKSARATERDRIMRELSFLNRLKNGLEDGVPIGDQNLDQDDARILGELRFLTAKPCIIAVNISENQLSFASTLETKFQEHFAGPSTRITVLCGKLEMELAQMPSEDEEAFRGSLEVGESGLNRMIRLSYEVLSLITFLTVGHDEVRAWTIKGGTNALKAAGKIHSDIERGFIRAETVSYDDLTRCGSLNEARKQGVLRQEGKTYVVSDGDVINFLFNV